MSARSMLRWLAIFIACAAAWDPAIRVARPVRPSVDVIGADANVSDLETRLRREGFAVNSGAAPAAIVLAADRAPAVLPRVPIWALDTSTSGVPNVRVVDVQSSATRFPGQSVRVLAHLRAETMQGQSTDVALEQDGIPVATAQHRWTSAAEEWTATFDYAPPDSGPVRLRVVPRRPGSPATGGDRADIRVPGMRAPLRVLAHDASVSWPAAFVRRSLEGDPAFAIVAKERVSTGVATRAGAPPDVLSQASLAPYEAVVVGTPDDLSKRDLESLRWFVEVRGGVVVFVAGRRPAGSYAQLLGVAAIDERVLRDPVVLDGSQPTPIRAAEMLVARGLSRATSVLARHGSDAVVFSTPRGRGRIVFFGAIDAWRYRGLDDDGFARFWRRMLLTEADSVPPRLAVDVEPALARPGDRVRVTARLRDTEWMTSSAGFALPPATAHVVRPDRTENEGLRLWPTAEPGMFEGEWTASGRGDANVTVTMGTATADAIVTVAEDVSRASAPDPDGLAMAVRASGGDVKPSHEVDALVTSMAARVAPRQERVTVHPMRNPWWLLPFVGALTIEWAWRRKRGSR